MRVKQMELEGVILVEPKVFGDSRGFFFESWHETRFRESGIPSAFVQDNVSSSARGVLRGLHFQNPRAQGKLVTVLQGEVYDVAVDIRLGSPHFGRWMGVVLSGENKRQLYIPEGFAHGFCVTSESALFMYKCTDYYAPEAERGIVWSDPDLAIDWPLERPLLSSKDAGYPRLRDLDRTSLPPYSPKAKAASG
jgi:dTDP-4-dehydrorhamnose 3,5-epimerase